MHYDLTLVKELCDDIGLRASMQSNDEVQIQFNTEIILCFMNIDNDDCLIGFKGAPSHFHGDAIFTDNSGYYIDVCYLDLITGICKGNVLVCELWESDKIKDRYLIHSEFNNEFQTIQPNEKFIIKSFAK